MGAELDIGARERLVEAIAGGSNVSAAAKVSGYSRIHVHRLLKDAAFLAEVGKARARVGGAEPDDMRAAKAVLVQVMNGEVEGTAPELAVRVSAAKAVIATFQARVRQIAGPAAVPLAAPIKILPPEQGKAEAEAWLRSQA